MGADGKSLAASEISFLGNLLAIMRNLAFKLALVALAFMTSFVLATQQPAPINRLYVFGDSLSDVGTVFHATGGMYPSRSTYFQGRYSNGRVWVEYLADRLHLTPAQVNNFACGGSTTGNHGNSPVPGLLPQVQSWLKTHPTISDQMLFVLWAGANDYLQGTREVTLPVNNIVAAVTALIQAKATRILVANLPDLGELPATDRTAQSPALTTLTQAHNQTLRRSLKRLQQQHPDLQLATLDANQLYRAAITNPAQFGLRNVKESCLVGAQVCPDPDRFLFWDGIHPTTAAHRILGETAFTALRDQGMVSLAASMLSP